MASRATEGTRHVKNEARSTVSSLPYTLRLFWADALPASLPSQISTSSLLHIFLTLHLIPHTHTLSLSHTHILLHPTQRTASSWLWAKPLHSATSSKHNMTSLGTYAPTLHVLTQHQCIMWIMYLSTFSIGNNNEYYFSFSVQTRSSFDLFFKMLSLLHLILPCFLNSSLM